MIKKISTAILWGGLCLLALSCASYLTDKNLDPPSRQFLSEVRYIITSQERKTFQLLPAEDRPAFIEEFWKKRDPDPYTQENEFKDQYYERMRDANELFREGTTPGWLQDRGRVYILLGPPERRDLFPAGSAAFEFPTEIWYYNYFPIVFVDRLESGDYRLEPISAQNITLVAQAQQEQKPKLPSEEASFDFNLHIRKRPEGGVLIQVEIPYKKIWLVQKDKRLETTLELKAKVADSAGKTAWDFSQDYPLSLDEQELAALSGKNYTIDLQNPLPPGEYSLTLEVKNKTDDSRMIKKGKFAL